MFHLDRFIIELHPVATYCLTSVHLRLDSRRIKEESRFLDIESIHERKHIRCLLIRKEDIEITDADLILHHVNRTARLVHRILEVVIRLVGRDDSLSR